MATLVEPIPEGLTKEKYLDIVRRAIATGTPYYHLRTMISLNNSFLAVAKVSEVEELLEIGRSLREKMDVLYGRLS